MRRKLLTAFLLGTAAMLYSQNVDSIKVEQAGDFIKIGYRILNSTPDQVFRVSILSSINGGLNTELRNVSGDVGDNVRGGRSEYFILWDVLKDVDELRSADFIVRAELAVGKPSRIREKGDRSFHLMYAYQLPGGGEGGIRTGYTGKVGFSLHYIAGIAVYLPDYSDHEFLRIKRLGLGMTSRLLNEKAFQMHLLTGVTVGELLVVKSLGEYGQGENIKLNLTPGLEIGTMVFHKWFAWSASIARVFPYITGEGTSMVKYTWVGLGLGLRF